MLPSHSSLVSTEICALLTGLHSLTSSFTPCAQPRPWRGVDSRVNGDIFLCQDKCKAWHYGVQINCLCAFWSLQGTRKKYIGIQTNLRLSTQHSTSLLLLTQSSFLVFL
ncbi:hypothetical protein C8R45DRAFT_951602 [Mycena sanguinolenta]|nr:hypothetical protein C8R45DRAFT_951602 [Mycena sanguinolenta]